MDMADFTTKIAAIAREQGRTHVHQPAAAANVEQDYITSPTLEQRVITGGEIEIEADRVRKRWSVLLMWLEPMPLDFNGDEAERVVERSWSDAVAGLRQLVAEGWVDADHLALQAVYDEHDANVGGMAATLDIVGRWECFNSDI